MVRDMYADLEKIEARGKRKKEKSKGLFSSFGKKDEPEPEEPAAPVVEEPKPTAVAPPAKQEPPKQAPLPTPKPVAQTPAAQAPAKASADPSWKPLTGGKLTKAEEELLNYKKWINKGYKSGVLTKDQCVSMVKSKEIELGLRPRE
ncbi:MAG: hypothetical protein PHU53_02795 [Thermoplasmata archaeon]|nr:hypothetical protein [Thermoplasmata archaeon]